MHDWCCVFSHRRGNTSASNAGYFWERLLHLLVANWSWYLASLCRFWKICKIFLGLKPLAFKTRHNYKIDAFRILRCFIQHFTGCKWRVKESNCCQHTTQDTNSANMTKHCKRKVYPTTGEMFTSLSEHCKESWLKLQYKQQHCMSYTFKVSLIFSWEAATRNRICPFLRKMLSW